jgi:hypothetical protein
VVALQHTLLERKHALPVGVGLRVVLVLRLLLFVQLRDNRKLLLRKRMCNRLCVRSRARASSRQGYVTG